MLGDCNRVFATHLVNIELNTTVRYGSNHHDLNFVLQELLWVLDLHSSSYLAPNFVKVVIL